jgi:hypothetical protein
MKLIASLVLLGSGLAAQGPIPPLPILPATGRNEKITEYVPPKNGQLETPVTVPPADVAPERRVADKAIADAGAHAIQAALDDPNYLAFDQPEANGPLWAKGANFKASFDGQGWQFIGQPRADATTLQPIHFRLAGAQVGSKQLGIAAVAPSRSEHRIEWHHGPVVEAIDVTSHGVEQTFTFSQLPRRGELVIDLAVATDLAAQNGEHGILFHGEYDQITYSPAVAIDANGARAAAETTWANGHITIRVPAGFVEQAALPLRIDPWVTAIQVASSTTDLADPDVAWDETGHVWAVVFAKYFGGSDWDCYVQRVADGNPMTLVGGPVTIDFTSAAWQRPRIANLQLYSVFMAVAPVRIGTNPVKVQGRIIANSGNIVTGQFDVATSAVDELRPDIGGDQTLAPRAAYFAIVWEHAYSATDHDIYYAFADASGNVTAPAIIQADTHYQSNPSISKSDGGGPNNTQRWAVVYQQTFAAGDEDIYGALLDNVGRIVPVGGSNTFTVDFSGLNDTWPQVSSPTLDNNGRRLMLAAYERTNSNNGDIVATCFDQAGLIQARANISVLDNDGIRLAWPQFRPSVDSDGYRFAVAYHEVFNGNTTINDVDTRVTLVGVGNGVIQAEERGIPLAFSSNREFNVQIASRYSGSGLHSQRYCTTNDRDNLAGNFAIDAYNYDGTPALSGVSTRTTGCGTLVISETGQAALTLPISFSLNSGTNLAGYIAGSATTAPIGPCPGCVLGVNGGTFFGRTLAFTIALNPNLIGGVLSVQGFMFAPTGPCLTQIHVSDTVDLTIQ